MILKIDNYDIHIEPNLIKNIEMLIKTTYSGDKIFVITDENVFNLYGNTLQLNMPNIRIEYIVIPAGEHSKSLVMYENVCKELILKGIRRNHMLMALGGGVVGDLTGFVSATLLRGIDYIQVPTTLLAMVDSSVGGKTGINLKEGKNLLGVFNNPKIVLIDTNFLKTLTEEEYRNGLAEVLKAGIIKDYSIVKYLKSNDTITENEIVKAINVKKDLVTKDPFDKNERLYLNFGHTFGHAIEMHFDYAVKHGVAISYGMLISLEIGENQKITKPGIYKEIKEILLRLKLVKEPLLNKDDFSHLLVNDKKQLSEGLRFVFVEDYEKPIIKKGVKF